MLKYFRLCLFDAIQSMTYCARMKTSLLLLILLSIPISTYAKMSGNARVVDGDTIEVAGTRIRLHGIDAPESKQLCLRGNVSWRCGIRSTEALREMVHGTIISCQERDVDRYGRIVAVCHANDTNLNAQMVSLGMAVAYQKYSEDFLVLEALAKANKIGLWAGKFVLPWEWRRGKRLTSNISKNAIRSGCQIKGNIDSKGKRIYHLPNTQWYSRTVINASKGEKWFCSEKDAIESGWRKAGGSSVVIPSVNFEKPVMLIQPLKSCCKICRKGKACGNSCINQRYTCSKPPGCACNK
jgi:endonuclease YncB( thermonuclease family)